VGGKRLYGGSVRNVWSSPVTGHQCERSHLASDSLAWPGAVCPLQSAQRVKADLTGPAGVDPKQGPFLGRGPRAALSSSRPP
jgi:hypothetical protein